jgi:hypothetical protein
MLSHSCFKSPSSALAVKKRENFPREPEEREDRRFSVNVVNSLKLITNQ